MAHFTAAQCNIRMEWSTTESDIYRLQDIKIFKVKSIRYDERNKNRYNTAAKHGGHGGQHGAPR